MTDLARKTFIKALIDAEQKKRSAEEKKKLAIWAKGKIVPGSDSKIVRIDEDSEVMLYAEYGNRDSDYGWEFHHVIRKRNGGSDAISNLIPLNWRSNLDRG